MVALLKRHIIRVKRTQSQLQIREVSPIYFPKKIVKRLKAEIRVNHYFLPEIKKMHLHVEDAL